MSIEEMLGIDDNDPLDQLAYRLVSSDSDFINNLIAWREERGLTQVQVAERLRAENLMIGPNYIDPSDAADLLEHRADRLEGDE